MDGVGSAPLADLVAERLPAFARTPVRVSGTDFLRPAGERFTWGREDHEALRTTWLDAAALEREVLNRAGSYLPALWDSVHDRSARRSRTALPARAVLLVDGWFLLGRGLTAELTVHLALSPAALQRRGVAEWQLPAFADYDAQVRPGETCDVLVRAEDPLRPAVLFR